MKLLLTGPNSFSGEIVLELLVKKGHEVTTISRQKLYGNYANKVTCIYSDLTKLEHLDGYFDAVVHIAATSPMKGVTSANLIQNNSMATQNLIRLASDCEIKKFIFFSTCSVYGDVKESVLSENTPIYNPCSYGASKLLCEAMLREQKLFQSIAIRLPAVIGSGAARHWLANTINKVKAGDDITIYNPNALFNNAIHIDRLAQFVEKLLHMPFPHDFDYINVASKEGLSIDNIADKIITKLKSSSKIHIGTTGKAPFSISSQYAIDKYAFEPLLFSDALDCYLDEC